MDTNGDSLSVEPMRLTGSEAYVYEAIATLEYLGRPATWEAITTMADQSSGPEIGRILSGLAARDLIERGPGEAGAGPVYRLVDRARVSAAPDDHPGATGARS